MKYTPDGYGERCRFDAFCKTVLRNEARTHLRDLGRQRNRETEFSALSQHEMDKLCTVDEYPSDSILFTAYLHIDVQGWDFQRTDTTILAFHTVNACIGGRLVAR